MKKLKLLFERLLERIAPKRSESIGEQFIWQSKAERLERIVENKTGEIENLRKELQQKDLLIERLVESQIEQYAALVEIQAAANAVDSDFMVKFVKDLKLPTGEALPEWLRKYSGKLYFEETQPEPGNHSFGMPPGRGHIVESSFKYDFTPGTKYDFTPGTKFGF